MRAICIALTIITLIPLRCGAGEFAAGLPAFVEQAENQMAVDEWLARQRVEAALREEVLRLLGPPPTRGPGPNSLISPVRLPVGALVQ
jgi:hypothetical protein